MFSFATADLLQFDKTHIWHPYTSAVDPHPVIAVKSAEKCTLFTEDGKELTDGMSSWWCAIHGYRNPVIEQAVRQQLETLPHIMFGGITHRCAVELAEKILAVAPKNMNNVFFADSGSVSVEVAIKTAIQFQQASGRSKRNKLMTFRGGYHGDTLGAMSVCDPVNGMHSLFGGIVPKQIFAERPAVPFDGNSASEDFCSDVFNSDVFNNDIKQLETLFEKHNEETAAFIFEPIVQGAGGMRFYHPAYLNEVRRLCNQYEVLLIADEIATGFGRTGKYFAVEWAGIQPDIMCIGKALTGGTMTLAAMLASKQVAEGVSADGNVLMHGPTFMANPLACAAASASLSLLEDGSWRENVRRIETRLKSGLEPCRGLSGVADVRCLGAIGVVEMERAVNTSSLQTFFVNHSVWLRPFNKLIYVMPPYCISDAEIDKITNVILSAVKGKVWAEKT
jgi:adenosylmethionine-8-amino-7-oxononanoate aminotransferase